MFESKMTAEFPRIAREALKLGSWEVNPDEEVIVPDPLIEIKETLAKQAEQIAALKGQIESFRDALIKLSEKK